MNCFRTVGMAAVLLIKAVININKLSSTTMLRHVQLSVVLIAGGLEWDRVYR